MIAFATTPCLHEQQPPLQFYLRVLEQQKWDRVHIVTNGLQDAAHVINPVVPALELKVAVGEIPGNIWFFKVSRHTPYPYLALHLRAAVQRRPMSLVVNVHRSEILSCDVYNIRIGSNPTSAGRRGALGSMRLGQRTEILLSFVYTTDLQHALLLHIRQHQDLELRRCLFPNPMMRRSCQNRTMVEDLASIVCADALVTAQSSLARSISYHTAATEIYFPFSCAGCVNDLEELFPGAKVCHTHAVD